MTDIIPRLLRACETGYGCRSVISWKGLAELRRRGLWETAAQKILELPDVHYRAQQCWLDVWVLGVFCGLSNKGRPLLDRDLTIDLARKVLPVYWGGDVLLYRGQLSSDPVGLSWAWTPMVALRFAKEHHTRFDKPGDDAVILRALVPASEIICAPSLEKKILNHDMEFVIDPRGIEYETQPVSEALSWIGWQTLDQMFRLGGVRINADGSVWIPDTIREWCLEAMLNDPELPAGALPAKALGYSG